MPDDIYTDNEDYGTFNPVDPPSTYPAGSGLALMFGCLGSAGIVVGIVMAVGRMVQ